MIGLVVVGFFLERLRAFLDVLDKSSVRPCFEIVVAYYSPSSKLLSSSLYSFFISFCMRVSSLSSAFSLVFRSPG